MTILWCGSDDIDYSANGHSTLFSPVTSCWLHSWFSAGIGWDGVIYLLDDSTGDGIGVNISGRSYCDIRTLATQTVLVTSTASTSNAAIDIHLINYGPNATINVYINGNLSFFYTGDISLPNVSGFNCIKQVNRSYTGYSQIILSTTDTRLLSFHTLRPDAAGDTNEWSGTYSDISEAGVNTSNIIYTNDANTNFQCNVSGLPSQDMTILGVKVSYQATQGIPGLSLQAGIKTNATNHLEDAITLDTYWRNEHFMHELNPVTGVVFTKDEINAIQISFKAV